MVAISLYRGNLHRVSDAPRRWALPPRAISLPHFKVLLRRRSLALSRLAAAAAAAAKEEVEEERKVKEGTTDAAASGLPIGPDASGSDPQASNSLPKNDVEAEEGKDREAELESVKIDPPELNPSKDVGDLGNSGDAAAAADVKLEVSNNANSVVDKEDRKRELEKKLHVSNEKKHNLVQMLKQILNAEEEIKRRNMQSSFMRSSTPLQVETAGEMGSVARQSPKLSLEVNFGDSGGELDGAAYHNNQARQLQQLHNVSPSAASLPRLPFSSLQHNASLHTPRATFPAAGHGQSASTSTVTSPSRFAPTGQQGQTSGLPPVALTNSHYVASSPSPAASAGASSVFRDPRVTSSS